MFFVGGFQSLVVHPFLVCCWAILWNTTCQVAFSKLILRGRAFKTSQIETCNHLCRLSCLSQAACHKSAGRLRHGRFSKVQSGKMGPAPRRFEHSKGTLKRTCVTVLGSETLNFENCELQLWKPTVHPNEEFTWLAQNTLNYTKIVWITFA